LAHFHFADQYRRGSSLIHRLDPRIKLLATLVFILVAAVVPPGAWLSYALLWAGVMFAAWRSGFGPAPVLKRSFIALPFALAAVTLPFTIPGETIAHIGGLNVSAEGLVRFASIIVKSWISVQIAILLTLTTAFEDLLWGMRELRIPKTLVGIVAFMYRYLAVLGDEGLRLMRARAARSGEAPGGGDRRTGGSLAWRGRVAGGMVGNLAMRAVERSERIYDAMVARGYQGEIVTLAPPVLTDLDRNLLVGWVTFLAMVTLIGFVL
jgi:cobalt/nickel transport system permease protein